MQLVDIAGRKIQIRKIGSINFMVILVFTVSGFTEMEIGLNHKFGISQNWREHCMQISYLEKPKH